MIWVSFLYPLFQDFFQLFYFGHLFLSIFQNLITFIKENFPVYILFIFELKAALNPKLYYITPFNLFFHSNKNLSLQSKNPFLLGVSVNTPVCPYTESLVIIFHLYFLKHKNYNLQSKTCNLKIQFGVCYITIRHIAIAFVSPANTPTILNNKHLFRIIITDNTHFMTT
jgi:hypothetical protein